APPLWQIKALRVIHDEQARDMIYREAWLEFWGQPVVYLPFFVHPDPTVKRRSGWLAPRFGQSSQVGATFSVPYYWSISPDRDLELEPIVYSKSGGILRSRYRQHLGHGALDLSGSIGKLDDIKNGAETGGSSWQGHMDLQGRFALDPTWRAGFDVEHVSKRTYLRLYRLRDVSTLTSRVFAEGFRGRNYAQISAYRLQGLEADDIGEDHPVIAPWGEYDYVGLPDKLGGNMFATASTVALHRDRGVGSKRLSLDLGYHLPHTTDTGHVLAATAKISSDVYHVNNFTNVSGELIDDDVITRVFPQLGVEWRYPLVRRGPGYTHLIEPRAMLVAAPDSGNSDDIPNEDSLNFAFDDTALFRLNRFNGRDRLSSGTHADYGVKLAVHGDSGGETSFSIGQSIQLSGDHTFSGESGLGGRLSDYVGHLIVAPTDTLDLHYRFRLDRDDLSAHRSELGFRYRQGRFELGFDHVKVSAGSSGTDLRDREQVGLSVGTGLSRYWRANFGIIHDFSDGENDTRDLRMSLLYEDECLAFGIRLEHSDTRDEDIEPDTALFFSINLKYLGDFAVSQGG
ncbi:MAG: LPS-assembly protein LptD, partial [Thalassobaculaceae bacterium]